VIYISLNPVLYWFKANSTKLYAFSLSTREKQMFRGPTTFAPFSSWAATPTGGCVLTGGEFTSYKPIADTWLITDEIEFRS
jgi:hypothetical protein